MISPIYSIVANHVERVAMRFGWALALHGSMQRDCDIIITPWTEDAEHNADIVLTAIYNHIMHKRLQIHPLVKEVKPNGRVAYALVFDMRSHYLDISVVDCRRSSADGGVK